MTAAGSTYDISQHTADAGAIAAGWGVITVIFVVLAAI